MRQRRGAFLVVVALAIAAALLFGIFVRRERPRARPAPIAAEERIRTPLAGTVATIVEVVSGNVRSSDGPIGNAHVCAADAASTAIGRPRTTCVDGDSQGHYAVTLPAAGAYSVVAEAQGFRPGSAFGGRFVSISAGERKADVDIVLERGGVKVAGVVLDLTGGPIHGAVVRATRFAPPQSTVATESDQAGRFALWVQPGHVALNAEAVGYVPALVGRVAPTSDVVITLTPGSNVRGIVVSSVDREPVADVEVRAVPVQRAGSPLNRSGTSDVEGHFGIGAIEPGEYALVAEGSGWRGQSDRSFKIGLAETVAPITVTVSPAALVTGRVVVRPGDSPCPIGTVTLTTPGQATIYDPPTVVDDPVRVRAPPSVPAMIATIEADGAVRFRAVPPGTYHAVVQCVDHVLREGPSVLEVSASGAGGIVWKVDAGLGLVVHMVDESDNPLPGAVVSLRSATRRLNMPLTADASGRYESPAQLFPGLYTLVAGGDGYNADPVDVDLREGMGKVDATVRFAGQGSIEVTVQGPNAEPIDDVRVRAILLNEPSPAAIAPIGSPKTAEATDEATEPAPAPPRLRLYMGIALGGGRFRIGPLASGQYRVQASDGVNPPFEGNSAGLSVGRGVVTTTIAVDRAGTIRGVVLDPSSQPVPDTWVSATCDAPTSGAAAQTAFHKRAPPTARRTMTAKDGRFSIRDLLADAVCSVRAEEPYGRAGMKSDVHPGDDVAVRLTSTDDGSGTRASLDNSVSRSPVPANP
jgi:Carboxypeptidase regulatory-like domain